MKHGDRVCVKSGPLAGLVGTILGEQTWRNTWNVHSMEGEYDMVTDFAEDELDCVK